jgi:hypothetical protein
MPNKAWQSEISRLVELGDAELLVIAWEGEVVVARSRRGTTPTLTSITGAQAGQALEELTALVTPGEPAPRGPWSHG